MVIMMADKLTNPRKYDRRITIQHFTTVGVDDEGITTKDWVPIVTLWAKRRPLTSRWREFFQNAGMNAEKMAQFEFRYREGITENMRLVNNGRTYDIKAVLDDVHGDKTETWIMALELNNG